MANNSDDYEPINEADEEEREINNDIADDEFREGMRDADFPEEEIEEQLRDLKKSP